MKKRTTAAICLTLALALTACSSGSFSVCRKDESAGSASVPSEAVESSAPSAQSAVPAVDPTGWTAADYDVYRAAIPYAPLAKTDYTAALDYTDDVGFQAACAYMDDWAQQRVYAGYVDREMMSLYDFLCIWGYCDREIASAADFTPEEVVAHLALAANAIHTEELTHGYDAALAAQVRPLLDSAIATGENKFLSAGSNTPVVLKEQLEQAARYFFGDEYVVKHCSGGIWIYHPMQGIYTAVPTDYAGFKNGCPLIADYAFYSTAHPNPDLAGTADLLLCYTAYDAESGLLYDTDSGNVLTGDYADNLINGVPAWQRNTQKAFESSNATWHKITLHHDDNGNFTFASHSYDVQALIDNLYHMPSNPD